MKRLFIWILLGAIAFGAASCTKDAEINARLDEQQAQIQTLRSDVNNLKDLFNQLKEAEANGHFILNVEEKKENDVVVGWVISMSNGKTIILMNGKDGKDGSDGKDGKDGKNGQDAVADVSVQELADGWKITVNGEYVIIPKAVPFSISFNDSELGTVGAIATKVSYYISGADPTDEVAVAAYAPAGWVVKVLKDEEALEITAPLAFEPADVIVFAANGKGKADMKVISFTDESVTVTPDYIGLSSETAADASGDAITVKIATNVEFTVSVSDSWIHYTPTKSWNEELVFTVDKNKGVERMGWVKLMVGYYELISFPIFQAGNAQYTADIELAGNTAAINVTVGATTGDFAYILAAVAATEAEALAIVDAGNGVKVLPNSVSDPLTPPVTGNVYVSYRIYNASDEEIDYESIPALGLSAEDAALYCGQYEFTRLQALSINNRSTWVDLTAGNEAYVENGYKDSHMVIAPSFDLLGSPFMVTDILGFGYDACGNESIIEEVLIPRNAGYSSFVDFSEPEAALSPMPATIANNVLTIDATPELFVMGDKKYYLVRDDAGFIMFDVAVSDEGDVTLTFGSNYYTLAIASEDQVAAYTEGKKDNADLKYKGDTSTIYFRGGNFSYGQYQYKPILKKTAEVE